MSSALLWLRPASDWVNIITVGIPARATSAASCSGPEGSLWEVPAVSRMASSQNSMSCGSNGIGSMLQIFDHSTVQRSLGGESLAGGAGLGQHGGEALSASRSRMSSVVSQRPTTAVTMPGKVLTLPMVATESGCLRAMGRISSASFAAAAQRVAAHGHRGRAGVRFLSVEGDCVAFDALGAEHNAERKLHGFENGALLDVQLEVGAGIGVVRWRRRRCGRC